MAEHETAREFPHADIPHQMLVGLIVERINSSNPWVDHHWRPSQVLTPPPATDPWTRIMRDAERSSYYAGAFPISLHPSATAQYRDNLESARPSLWVAMRPAGRKPPVEILALTADTSEGEGYTETGTSVVETVPMPAEIAAFVAEFVAAYHIERVFEKRQRDKTHSRQDGARRDASKG